MRNDFADDFQYKLHVRGCRDNPGNLAERQRLRERAAADRRAQSQQLIRRAAVREGRAPILRLATSEWMPAFLSGVAEVSVTAQPGPWALEVVEARIDGGLVELVRLPDRTLPDRRLELPDRVLNTLMVRGETPLSPGPGGGWQIDVLAYATHREQQTLELHIPRSRDRIEYRYEFEDLS